MTYYDWLVYLIAPDYHQREQYSELLFALYSIEFYWVVPRDRNRAKDGLELRDQFEHETGLYCDCYGSCNCLEMLIALAIRCENELMYMYNPKLGDQTDRWFWMMIDNLELMDYVNECFDYEEVDDILTRFMSRNYGPGLKYCPFPVSVFVSDFEKMELAYQMNYYIREKFYRKY